MESQISSLNHFEHYETGYSQISKWTRLVSIIYFINSVIFFAASFIPFFIKRTEGYDSYYVSGAHSGTTQLLLFVVINIAALVSFTLGYYLTKFSAAFHDSEGAQEFEHLEPALINLKHFFKLLGIVMLTAYVIASMALLIRIT